MKAEELMIGDLVCYDKANNYYTQIKEIKCTHDIPDDVVYYIKGMRDRRDRLWIEFEETFVIDILSPIPLTQEILEKNEFKNDDKDKNMYYWNWSICNNCISYDKETGKIRIFHSLGNLVFVLPLRYLHELQHALKLCEIPKEIVL